MSLGTTDVVVVTPPAGKTAASSYLEWSPILGGAVLSAAISTTMVAFGSAIGLSLVSADSSRSTGVVALMLAGAVWALWVTVSACAAGGYLAGRMRKPIADASISERSVRDGAHGLVVWALGALLVAALTSSSLVGAAKTATAGAAAAAGGAAALVTQQADPLASAVDALMRSTGTEPISQAERDEASRILVRSVANGSLDPADRGYIASRMAARMNIPQAEAEKKVDEAYAKLNQAKEAAKQAAEKARRMSVIIAFLTAAALLVGAASAYLAAKLGGQHRDEEIDFMARS